MASLTIPQSNYTNIQQAIANIATTGQNVIAFGTNYKVGDVPTPDDLTAVGPNGQPAVGWPYFVVRQGKLVGFATGLELNSPGDTGLRGSQLVEPVWDFECYAFYEYLADNPNYGPAATALVTLVQVFIENYTLNGTCALANPHTWSMPYAEIGQQSLIAAKFTVRAYETLYATYQ